MPDKTETTAHIELSKLIPFPDHPFAVREDEAMPQTVESVKEYGVIVPAIARPLADGTYELISGHWRKRACELAGLTTMPVIVRDITNPRLGNNSYDKWLGNKAKLSNREKVRITIDEILAKNPRDFDAFLSMLEAEGYTVKHGKPLALSHLDFKKNIRMSPLGDGYTEDEIGAIIG